MNNLFVMHTQYNLMLACGLVETTFSMDCNDLILFCDFSLALDMKDKLQSVFGDVLYLSGSYPKVNESYLSKIKRYPGIFQSIKCFVKKSYSQVFLVDDMCIPEHHIMKCAAGFSKEILFTWLEDGGIAYFSNNAVSGGLGANRFSRFMRMALFKYAMRLGKFYDLTEEMGGHSLIDRAYVTFPEHVRKHLKTKELVEIGQESFNLGMKCLFGGSGVNFDQNCTVIILDMLSVYGTKMEDVKKALIETINFLCSEGQTIYYKYHPREETSLSELKPYIELDRKIAIESYLINASSKELTVVGVKSTGLQTARKMGFNAISLLRTVEPDNFQVIDFYQAIGVNCPYVSVG